MIVLRSTWYLAAGRKPHGNLYTARSDSKTTTSLSLGDLAKLRKRSMRKGAWYQALTKEERGIIDLTLRCVEKVRSRVLEGLLIKIASKLRNVLDHFFTWKLESIGRPIAERLCRAASALGVKGADEWKEETSYVQLLGLNHLSSSAFYR